MKALIAAALVAASIATPAEAGEKFDPAAIGAFLKALDGSPAEKSPTLDNPTAKRERMKLRCESWIMNHALETSPVTYRSIDVEELGPNIQGEPLMRITYDAQNLYGAIVRKKAVCRFDDSGHLIED